MDAGLAVLAASMLAAGLASGAHCAAMCGGIVTAFDAQRAIPIVAAVRPEKRWPRRLAFHAGRISAYAGAGAAAGALGAAAWAGSVLPAQLALQLAASAALLLAGLWLAGAERWLRPLERIGVPLWRRLAPAAARLSRGAGAHGAYAAGLAWGFLPCAMVYGALGAAALAASPARGALAMAAFGAGTLPFLLFAGGVAAWLWRWRRLAGAVLAGSGAWGLARAAPLGEAVRATLLCV
jgi:sulfite exporter TauE/SafE